MLLVDAGTTLKLLQVEVEITDAMETVGSAGRPPRSLGLRLLWVGHGIELRSSKRAGITIIVELFLQLKYDYLKIKS